MNENTKKKFDNQFDNSEDFQFSNMKDYLSGKFADTWSEEQE
jgi:hypothetical protein